MDKCLNCEKELKHSEGRRKKKFCSDNCRSRYWIKNNKEPKTKTVSIEEWNRIQEQLNLKSVSSETSVIKKDVDIKRKSQDSGMSDFMRKRMNDKLGIK